MYRTTCKATYNIYLSGGGLKGAYQYGFFKELYRVWPDFPVKRVYAVSVGAINSVPIVTRNMAALDPFWNNPDGIHPFDLIVEDWPMTEDEEDKPIKRVKSLFKHGSLFKNLKKKPHEDFLNQMSEDNWNCVKEKLFIISFCKKNKETRIMPCTSKHQILDAIAASSRFPGLFECSEEATEIDGAFADIKALFQKEKKENERENENEKWLCLDIQNDPLNFNFENEENKEKFTIFRPLITKIPWYGHVSALLSNRFVLDHLIQNGIDDAQTFYNKTLCVSDIPQSKERL